MATGKTVAELNRAVTRLWVQTLFNVADVIEAFFSGVSPAELGQYTLHAVVDDGVEGPALKVNLRLSDLTAGLTPETPLVIKSKSVLAPPITYMPEATAKFKAFAQAQFIDGCIVSPAEACLPFPQMDGIQKVYVRNCYEDIFRLLNKEVENGTKYFAISGTPGIGKSLSFIYILRCLMSSGHASNSLKVTKIVYQTSKFFMCFDLEKQIVSELTSHMLLVDDAQTLYIIDGCGSQASPSSCVTLFIASPRSKEYKEFVKQRKPCKWYYPIWTKAELEDCRVKCYPNIPEELLEKRYKACGGVARFVLDTDKSIGIPTALTHALSDVNAVMAVKQAVEPTDIFPLSHSLVHMLVGTDENGRPYQFLGLDIASNYVGEELWEKHARQMVENLQYMFGGGPNEISRHLFEIYGHLVFSSGGPSDGASGRLALKYRKLPDGPESELVLQDFGGERANLKQNPLPNKPIAAYHQPSDDPNFPAIDSLSPQGLFQFTVGTEHPIRNVPFVRKLCDLYDPPTPKLYFVVPPERYRDFKEQVFLMKGQRVTESIPKLEQYVVELPVGATVTRPRRREVV
ncbi:hypothetical protein HDU77_011646 [Chytriomyces hyalinus]|nr:hypothetical protein HDU77_011646 [Chytriomyces hyalinus]